VLSAGRFRDLFRVPADILVRIAVCLGLLFAVAMPARSQENKDSGTLNFTTFDAPGAGNSAYVGTFALTINTSGDLTGTYADAFNVSHGFVRGTDGTITEFNAPGAGRNSTEGTFAISINSVGAIAGYYSDTNTTYHGIVRAANGTLTEFDAPGADMFDGHLGTAASSINTSGVVTGFYRDINYFITHGFVRATNGAITTFDAPGGDQGTEPISINDAGVTAGTYLDVNYAQHGFVRAANGSISVFDAPGAGTNSGEGTVAVSVNTAGVIAGTYIDSNYVAHGFVRAANGTITEFDAPGSGMLGWVASLVRKSDAPPLQGTYGLTINDAGSIVGPYLDSNMVVHGYVRAANGAITEFDAPGAGTGAMQGTIPVGINATGDITGSYLDANNVLHGFVTGAAPTALQFLTVVPPCRLVDTRKANGEFGGPALQAKAVRSFTLPSDKNCRIPASAAAYSLNVTVVPHKTLGYLTVWATGQPQPQVSTLNSIDGRVKANAAIVKAGTRGAISFYVSDTTDLLLDIDGYFTIPSQQTLQFYPLSPCRIADTRGPRGALGGPFLMGLVPRSFPVLQATACFPQNVTPAAYSLNFTAVPHGPLGYLTVWPTGQNQPNVSTLNAPTGTTTANAAIVPAGTNGAISTYASNNTDLLIDIDGYFDTPGQSGLSLYPVAPCRVLDTRNGKGAFSGTLSPPVDVVGSGCAVSSQSQAYVFNATALPMGPLGYLTLWPYGSMQPLVSTLNAGDGAITSNMAIVPAGTGGKVDAYANGLTQLLLDISSYFAP